MYDPSDRYSKVTVKVATGCSENTKSEIISTVDKFREQVDQSVSVSASAEGGAAGVCRHVLIKQLPQELGSWGPLSRLPN